MRWIALAFFEALWWPAFSQKVNSEYRAEADALRTHFREHDVAATQALTTVQFEVNPVGGLQARVKDDFHLLALKPNARVVVRNSYNLQIAIESASLKTEAGKVLAHDKMCGNVQRGDIFYSDAQVCVYAAVRAQVGQGAKFESTRLVRDPRYLPVVFFYNDFPAKQRELQFVVPEGVEVELVEMNFSGLGITREVRQESDRVIHRYRLPMAEGHSELENLPGALHYEPHILLLTKGYRNARGESVRVLADTKDLYQWYRSLTDLNTLDENALKPTVEKLASPARTAEEKIRAIYSWVQENIKYIAFEDGIAGFKPDDAHQVFYKRYGDCKGMANLTKSMLQLAGLDARLTWIGTERIPYTYDLPSLAVDNHMICTVYADGVQYILDPTDRYGLLGFPGGHIQGKEMLIENGKDYEIGKVPDLSLRLDLQESRWRYSLGEQALLGEGETTLRGDAKKRLQYLLDMVNPDDRAKVVKAAVAGHASLTELEVVQLPVPQRDSILSVNYTGKFRNQVYRHEKEVYLDLDFDDELRADQIPKTRKLPFHFSGKSFKRVVAEFELPTGYEVVQLPRAFSTQSEYFSFSLRYQHEKNRIIYTKELKILKPLMPTSEFGVWNKAIDELKKSYNEQIILKTP